MTKKTNNITKGLQAEQKSVRYLRKFGYRTIRSAGSRSPFDVVALGEHNTLLVQVRSHRHPTMAELEVMLEFPVAPGVLKVIHVWKKGELWPVVRPILAEDLSSKRRNSGRKKWKNKEDGDADAVDGHQPHTQVAGSVL